MSDRMQIRGFKYMFGRKRFSCRAIDESREDTFGSRDVARTCFREDLGGRPLSFEPKD